ncbi:MAG: coproporphyrinogen III oxidase [Rhodobacteraceae bacterium]|nr:coproporphyrinogen III oxidase [Paracoccaceae bacterium]MBR25743.1 coproporphyrinogen III oxidase [Paracoccaceae bacterium]
MTQASPKDEDWRAGGFGIYVHWPYCLAKCPYCDFNSHVARVVDQEAMRAGLLAQLRAARELTGPRVAGSLFFGGGTPSLMPPETAAAVIEEADRLWGFSSDAEITLEANPTSIEAGRFAGYAAGGVNRVSMGAQALNDADLKRLGRMHTAAEARAAFDIARAAFARVSFDLIYARQDQTPEAWEAELAEALRMAIDHLSLYQLTVEPGTRFGELHDIGKLRGLPDDDRAADMYAITQSLCEAAGMPAYEISNHARPGAESRHNLVYWRGGDYAGVGAGAHGRVTAGGVRLATETPRAPAAWLESAGRGAEGFSVEPISDEDRAVEYLMMSLRLAEGARLDRYARLAGAPLDESRIVDLEDEGLVIRGQGRLIATERGRALLNGVLRALLV